MKSRIGRIGLAALAACVVLAGCGSSSKPKLTKTQFLTQADVICKAGNATTNAIAASLGNNPSKAQVVRAANARYFPAIQSQINAVRALAVQTADKGNLTSILDIAQSDLDKVKANPVLLFSNGPSPFHNFAVQARSYGLTECAKNA